MRLLGLSSGNPRGSAEILLTVALAAAEREGAEVALVRLDDLELPTRPVAPGMDAGSDAGPWLWDQLMDSDGLIVATPIYSRTITGRLKLVADRLSGPASDVAFAENYRRMLEAGETPPVAFPYDERVFRPRVCGFIAVGGARTAQWKSLALPLMHQMTFSAHMAVADQLLCGGAGMPQAIVLDDAALAGAERVGHSVGSQLGRSFADVEYRGEPGICPLCHLSVIELRDSDVECATCGAGGSLVVQDGVARVSFADPVKRERSVITLAEKRAHFAEVMDTAAEQRPAAGEIAERADRLLGDARRLSPRPAQGTVA